jgi:hypothetical protein
VPAILPLDWHRRVAADANIRLNNDITLRDLCLEVKCINANKIPIPIITPILFTLAKSGKPNLVEIS